MPPSSLPPDRSIRETAAHLALLRDLQAALSRDQRDAIVDLGRQVVGLRPELGGQWVSLALAMLQNGEVTLGRRAIEAFVEQSDRSPASRAAEAAYLATAGFWDESLAALRLLDDPPDPAIYAFSRGTAALYVAQPTEAREWLERAVEIQLGLGSAWLSLATLVDLSVDEDLFARLEDAAPAVARAPTAERAAWYYARGKGRHDRGDHAGAYASFAQGAQLIRSTLAYSRERDAFTANDATAGYSAERIAALSSRQGEPTQRAIFVLGLPRSGTTLVEQILTGHSAVSDGGEINRLPLLLKDIGGLSLGAVENYVDRVGAAQAARLWRHWLSERFPVPGRIVDKTFNSSRLLGFAATLLPEAPLVWIRRDPLDCAWSCFRSRFVGGAPWSYDLEDMAFHFRLEDRLLEQWQDLLGERLLVLDFDQLVSEPEPEIGRILAHCGLPEEPGPYAPHENARPVTTSSTMQVRQPINRKGIGAADPYREYLRPFLDAYEG